MVFKPLKYINNYPFTINAEITIENPQLIFGEYDNSYYNEININNQKYINYHFINTNFYKHYYTTNNSILDTYNYNQIKILNKYLYYIQIPQNMYKSGILTNSLEIHLNNNEILYDDGNGNLIKKYNDDFYYYYKNVFLNKKILWITFDELKYYTQNRFYGIYKTKYFKNNQLIDTIFLEDKSGYDNKIYLSEKSNFYNEINGRYYYTPNGKINIIENENILSNNFMNEFSILIHLDSMNVINGEHIIMEYSNTTNTLFKISVKKNDINPNLLDVIMYFKQYGIEQSFSDTMNIINEPFSIYLIFRNGRIYLVFFSQNNIFSFDFDFSNIYDKEIFWKNKDIDKFILSFFNVDKNNPNGLSSVIKEIIIFNALFKWEYLKSYFYDNMYKLNFGNIMYNYGIIVLTDNELVNEIKNGNIWIKKIKFKNKSIKIEKEFVCEILPSEYNYSINPTISTIENAYKENIDNVYITDIGLYDDRGNLLLIARPSIPIKKSKKIPLNIIIKYDIY